MSLLAYILLATGMGFVILAGLGLARMPTLFLRMQVTSKASTLGVILMVLGLFLLSPGFEVAIKGVLVCGLLLLTAPIAAHAIAIAAKKHGCDR